MFRYFLLPFRACIEVDAELEFVFRARLGRVEVHRNGRGKARCRPP